MANPLNQFAAGCIADLLNQGVTLFPISGIHFHLYQFVVLQRKLKFIGDPFTKTGVANNNDRLEVVGQFTKMTLLGFG